MIVGDRSERRSVEIERFGREHQAEVERLILDGLVEHWGVLDPQLNPDLDDIETSYAGGTVLLARIAGRIVAAGAIVPVSPDEGEVKRMSVARTCDAKASEPHSSAR